MTSTAQAYPRAVRATGICRRCVAGALSDYEYVAKLTKAGFESIEIETTRVYNIDHARTFLSNRGLDVDEIAKEVEGKFTSAFVRATKPQ